LIKSRAISGLIGVKMKTGITGKSGIKFDGAV